MDTYIIRIQHIVDGSVVDVKYVSLTADEYRQIMPVIH